MFMFCYFAPTANTLAFETMSLCSCVAIIFYVDVDVLLLCLDSIHPSCVRDRVYFVQQSVRSYVAIIVVVIDRLNQ